MSKASKSNIKKPVSSKDFTLYGLVILAIVLIGAGLFYFKGNSSNSGYGGSNAQIKTAGDVENVIAKWVENNPDAIIKSVMSMQQKMMEQQQQDARSNISSKMEDIYNSKGTPVSKKTGYDISIVEFFDYNCGYCKRAQNTVDQLIKQDPKVRVVFKEYPILSPGSEELARVALAVNIVNPNKYLDFHNLLMQSNARGKDAAIRLLKDVSGLDVERVKKALIEKKDQIQKQIDDNRKLGASIGVNGTPAFVIGEELIPGAVGLETLKAKIAQQRKNK